MPKRGIEMKHSERPQPKARRRSRQNGDRWQRVQRRREQNEMLKEISGERRLSPKIYRALAQSTFVLALAFGAVAPTLAQDAAAAGRSEMASEGRHLRQPGQRVCRSVRRIR